MSEFNPIISQTENKFFNKLKDLGLNPESQYKEKILI